MNIGKYNSLNARRPMPLPVKPLLCSLCSYTSRLGPNDLQLHLDTRHRGWAEEIIKKITVGRDHIRSSNPINLVINARQSALAAQIQGNL